MNVFKVMYAASGKLRMECRDHMKNAARQKSLTSRGNFLRKSLLFGLLFLFCTVTLFAANPVTVKSGNVSVIKKPSIALLEIYFSDTRVGDETMEDYQQRRGDNFIEEWPEAVASTHLSFVKFFNRKNKKGMQLTTEAMNASYKMVININYLNMGDSFSWVIPYASKKAGGMLMKGYIDIIDMETNHVVCSLNMDGVKGVGLPHLKDRLQSMFNYLADNIYSLK